MKDEEKKEKILNILTNEWQSTREIAVACKIDWYQIKALLTEMYYETEEVERIKLNKRLIWRKKINVN